MDDHSRAELQELLLSILEEADVRRLVRFLPGGEDMHAELPGAGTPLKDLVHQAAALDFFGDAAAANGHLRPACAEAARASIAKTGYHCRDGELAALDQAISRTP